MTKCVCSVGIAFTKVREAMVGSTRPTDAKPGVAR
jgi:hypothetical protein